MESSAGDDLFRGRLGPSCRGPSDDIETNPKSQVTMLYIVRFKYLTY